MRTDVKVGLICAFAIVLGAIIYFVAQGNTHPAQAANPSQPTPVVSTLTPAPTTPTPTTQPSITGIVSTPSPAPASPTPVATPTPERILAASAVSTPIIPAPGSGATPTTMPSTPAFGTPAAPSMTTATAPAVIRTPGSGTPGAFGTTSTFGTSGTSGEPFIPSPRPSMEFTTPPSTSGLSGTTYKIQKGDMLGTIAKKYGVTVRALETANPGINSNNLKIDSTIKIPASSTASASSSSTSSSSSASASHTTPTPTTPTVAASSTPSSTPKSGATYKVKKGDTLTTIAKTAYGSGSKSAIQKILQANRSITNPNLLSTGTELKLP